MIPIDRSEIETWGKTFDAKGNFPKLIGKLIRETTPKSTNLNVPSGSAVNLGGWDGIVYCNENSSYVPSGISLWEIGTNGKPSKANADYLKRTENSLGFNKKEVCYIVVTTNLWEDKNKWAAEKKQEEVWKDVRVYDSIDIAEWLENAQISCRWFSILTKNHPYDGIYTAEEYWKMLSIGPKGQLPPKIVISGREQQSKKLLEFLSGDPGLKAIKGGTKEEAIAFIIASAMMYDLHSKELFFSRSVVVDSENNFHGLRINKNAINLIAKLDISGKLYVAAHDNGHHVLVPLGPDDSFGSQDILTLPRIDREGQIEALIEMGLSHEDATKYSKETGRDYTILKNLLDIPGTDVRWKNQDNVIEIIPALLIGRWDESKLGDRMVLERLSGKKYDEYIGVIQKWLRVESPPLIQIGTSWRLTSPLDAWTTLSKYILVNDFEKLKICFIEALSEINPIFKSNTEQSIISPISGKDSIYSDWCKEGLTQSLILLGIYGENFKFHHSFSAQNWVDSIIKDLLYNAPGVLWASLNNEMPLIAEASPKSFFDSAYHSLSLNDKPIMMMFTEKDNYFSTLNFHTGLLWALEGFAWSEEYVYDASILLAKLASLDPGGKITNRPLNSLLEIYKPWFYQTLAPFEVRMKILEQIGKREPEIGWKLLNGLIPNGSDTAMPTNRLRWRLFERSYNNPPLWTEIFETHSRIINMLIEFYDYSENRLIDLLKNSVSDQILPNDRENILSFLESNINKIKVSDHSAWHEIRKILSHHRSFPQATWALTEEVLNRYEELYKKLEPVDPIEKILWMFNDSWPKFPEGELRGENSYDDQEKFITHKRVEALQSIYKEYGIGKLQEIVKIIKETGVFGDALAFIIKSESDILLLCELLKDDKAPVQNFIQRFFFRKSLIEGLNWIFDLFTKLKNADYSEIQLSRVFLQVEQNKQVWDFIKEYSSKAEENYWKEIYPRFWNLPMEDVLFGTDKLLQVNRFISALNIVYHELKQIPTEKLIEILEKAGTLKSEDSNQFDNYHVIRIFEELENRENIDKGILIKLEWLYLPLFTSYSSHQKPKILHDEISQNPTFFIQLLNWAYRAENEEKEETKDETILRRAENAYKLLRSWDKIPGVQEDLTIDEPFFWSWILTVRELAEQSGRLRIADVIIGQVLAEYPENKEPWPPTEICKVIDTINTDSLKSGFTTGAFNKRGSSVRSPFEGGKIERGHANYFRSQADKLMYDFPETAKMLRNLAERYDIDAKRMDEIAEKDELDN